MLHLRVISYYTYSAIDKIFSAYLINVFIYEIGMELIVCETASNSFQNIIHILAGPNERLRARHLLERIKVLPDLTNEQEQSAYGYSKLKISGQIKVRSLKIFLFGIYHKAITVSSNEGFVRSARMQVR